MAKKEKYEIKASELKELTPVIVGNLKKNKQRSPLIIIMLFVLFICFAIYLPDIVDYITNDGEEDVKKLAETENGSSTEEEKETIILSCVALNFKFNYYFVDEVLTRIVSEVVYTKETERYSDYLIKYNSYKDKYNSVNGVTASVTESDTGFTFNLNVTYPNDDVSSLNNFALVNSDITKDEVIEKMEIKKYTCS